MMDQIDRDQLYNTAWQHWGEDMQLDICIEEMAEFIKEIIKCRRKGILFSDEFAGEIADVCICIEQIKARMKKTYFTDDNRKCNMWDDVAMVIKEEKLERLKSRLFDSLEKKFPDIAPRDGER
jgi:hypothetical protein